MSTLLATELSTSNCDDERQTAFRTPSSLVRFLGGRRRHRPIHILRLPRRLRVVHVMQQPL